MQPSKDPNAVPEGPRVSAILISRNCLADLRRALEALKRSSGRDRMEVFVVDAASRDGSGQLETEFPEVTFLRLPRNFGRTRLLNIAFRSAQAGYTLLLDPRVELDASAVQRLSDALDEHGEATAVTATLKSPDGKPQAVFYSLPQAGELGEACVTASGLPLEPAEAAKGEGALPLALLVRHPFLKGMNYLQEKDFAEFWPELDLCRQIRNAGKRILRVPEAVGTVYPAPEPSEDAAARALAASDRVSAAGSYLGRQFGFGVAIGFRMRVLFGALGRMLVLKDPGFNGRLALNLLSGVRIDGTQPDHLA